MGNRDRLPPWRPGGPEKLEAWEGSCKLAQPLSAQPADADWHPQGATTLLSQLEDKGMGTGITLILPALEY